MRVKPVDPNAVIRDPHTKRQLPAEGGDVPETSYWTRRWLAGEIWKREGDKWFRRQSDGHLVIEPCVDAPASQPTGREPVQPLTTREGK